MADPLLLIRRYIFVMTTAMYNYYEATHVGPQSLCWCILCIEVDARCKVDAIMYYRRLYYIFGQQSFILAI